MRLLKTLILIILFVAMFFYVRSEENKIRCQKKSTQVSKVTTVNSDSLPIDSTSQKKYVNL